MLILRSQKNRIFWDLLSRGNPCYGETGIILPNNGGPGSLLGRTGLWTSGFLKYAWARQLVEHCEWDRLSANQYAFTALLSIPVIKSRFSMYLRCQTTKTSRAQINLLKSSRRSAWRRSMSRTHLGSK